MNKKVVIVGGVAGGASTAARLRRLDEDIEIVMFERGQYISFANCGLPYYIGGTIEEREALLLQTPEAMKERFNIDVRVENEVVKIDKEKKIIEVKDLSSGETYQESYDTLVLSTGSTPIKPSIPGIDSSNIFSLWTIPDTDAIKEYIDTKKVENAVVIGGGFIGIEMAENLHDLGIKVSLVEMDKQVMAPIDYEMAQLIHGQLVQKGVNLYLENGVTSFESAKDKTIVNLQDNTQIETDLVILSIGIRPNGELAKDAGLIVNKRGGIVVDDCLKTSDENIYALGDVIEVVDFINNEKTMIPLAGPANKQGRIVANNIVGVNETYKGTQGTSVVKAFDLTVASTGNNEKTLKKNGKKYGEDYKITVIQPKSHAGYYPGAIPMVIKLIFDLEGKILGAQIVGYDGVDKRIDVIATLIRMGGTIYDLKELELAYAPPYSSAKDPVNMAGFTAENIINGNMDIVLWDEIDTVKNAIILDVRDELELTLGSIENAINIPVNELRDRLDELDKRKEILIYCAIGIRGYIAARILEQKGYKARNLIGGYNFYKCVIKDYSQATDIEQGCYCCGDNRKTEENKGEEMIDMDNVIRLNACGLQCPGPILQVSNKIKEIEEGEILEVSATDPGFPIDVQSWCKTTNNTFINTEKRDKEFVVWIKKGRENMVLAQENKVVESKDGSTMVVFSGDLDKAIASFIIANGAAAMGKKVTMFFTFWGLNVIRKTEKVNVKKSFIENMLGFMMPRGTGKLALSKMHMGGMGSAMMKKVMKDKNVDSLDDLMNMAMNNGVKVVACTMSMDVMGIKEEELIDGVELGGVAAYLGKAEESNHNLFI